MTQPHLSTYVDHYDPTASALIRFPYYPYQYHYAAQSTGSISPTQSMASSASYSYQSSPREHHHHHHQGNEDGGADEEEVICVDDDAFVTANNNFGLAAHQQCQDHRCCPPPILQHHHHHQQQHYHQHQRTSVIQNAITGDYRTNDNNTTLLIHNTSLTATAATHNDEPIICKWEFCYRLVYNNIYLHICKNN